jgi:hypothetical protein
MHKLFFCGLSTRALTTATTTTTNTTTTILIITIPTTTITVTHAHTQDFAFLRRVNKDATPLFTYAMHFKYDNSVCICMCVFVFVCVCVCAWLPFACALHFKYEVKQSFSNNYLHTSTRTIIHKRTFEPTLTYTL